MILTYAKRRRESSLATFGTKWRVRTDMRRRFEKKVPPYGFVTTDGDVDQSPRGIGGGLDTSQEVPGGRTDNGVAVSQSIQWSSEYHDTELGLVYYKTADGCKGGPSSRLATLACYAVTGWTCAKHAPRRGEATRGCRRINYRYYNPTDGRWMRRDPIGESASLSLFAYVNNNPTIFVDERGLKVSISADKNTCTIIVNLNIVIYSSSTHPVKRQELETLKQTIKNSIESRWNGFKKGCCDIEFRVSISIGDGDDIPWWIQRLFSSVNYIEITNEDKYRSRVYGKGGGTGTWWANANEWVYAHETGHLAGLPYKDEKRIDPKTGEEITVSVPDPGHEGHMMATFGGEVAQHEVDDIVNNVSCPCYNK